MTKLYSTGSSIQYAGQTSCERRVKCQPYGSIPVKCANISFANPGGIVPPKNVRSVIGSITSGKVPNGGWSGGISKTYCEDEVNVETFYTRIVGTKNIVNGPNPSDTCTINNVNNNLSCCAPPDDFDCKKTRIPPYFLGNETNGCNYSYKVISETYTIFLEQVNPEYFCKSSIVNYTSFFETVGFAAWGWPDRPVGLPTYEEKCLRLYPDFESDFGDEACYSNKSSKSSYDALKLSCQSNNISAIINGIQGANMFVPGFTDPPLTKNPYPEDYIEVTDFQNYRPPLTPVGTISCSLEDCIEEKLAELLNLGNFLECYSSCEDGTPCPQVVGDGSDKLWYCDGSKCVQPDILDEKFDPSKYTFGPVSYDTCMKNCPDYDPTRCFPADMRNYMAHRYYEPDGTLLYCCSNEYKEVSAGYLNPKEGCSYPYGNIFQWTQKKQEEFCKITNSAGNPTCLSNMSSNIKIKEYQVCSIGRYNFFETSRINPKCWVKLYEYEVPGWPYSCDPKINDEAGEQPDNCYGVPCPYMKRENPQYVKEKVVGTFQMQVMVYYCEVSVSDCE